ncbi:hypothetical protein ACFQU2_20700 [Siccirubricoccus deserti]
MNERIAFVCSCEDSMPLDGKALGSGCAARGTELRTAEQLCRSQLDRFLAALETGRPITVACTQEAPLFAQEAEAAGATTLSPLSTSGSMPAGRPKRPRPGQRWRHCWPPPRCRCRRSRWCR